MDERRRDLERKAAAGDPQAAARLLEERVRSGELTREHVLLLAELGHPPALAIAGPVLPMPRQPSAAVERLSSWGLPVAGRACIALVRSLLKDWQASGGEALFVAAEAWCDEPSHENAEHLSQALAAVPATFEAVLEQTLGPFTLLGAASRLAASVSTGRTERLARVVSDLLPSPPDPLDSIRAELVPWILTQAPPLTPKDEGPSA